MGGLPGAGSIHLHHFVSGLIGVKVEVEVVLLRGANDCVSVGFDPGVEGPATLNTGYALLIGRTFMRDGGLRGMFAGSNLIKSGFLRYGSSIWMLS